MPLIYVVLFLSLLLLIGITMLFFSVKRKSVLGIFVSIVLVTPISILCIANTIDELNISKKDVISDLKYLEIDLKDDFKITNNTVTGMPERIQQTEIEISKDDKNRIIQLIRNASNFKSDASKNDTTEQLDLNDTIKNFKHSALYSREVFKIIDDYPTRIWLTVEEGSNILEYKRIED